MNVLTLMVSSIFQVIVFSAVPFLVWLIWHRKQSTFFSYVGIKKPKFSCKWWLFIIILTIYLGVYFFNPPSFFSENIINAMKQNVGVASNQFAGMGAAAIAPVLLISYIQNGLCEELFFRGFIGKCLIGKTWVLVGVILQAMIFAIIHNFMFASVVPDLLFHLYLFISITVMASILCIFNEKVFGGSIWVSIFIHGTGNFISTMLIAYNVC